jgi:hypothetical protein
VKTASLLKAHGFEKVFNGGAWTDLEAGMKSINK